jgi:hypothetical protein
MTYLSSNIGDLERCPGAKKGIHPYSEGKKENSGFLA